MTDCLLIGFNDSDFAGYVEMLRSLGEDSGPYRDLKLAFVEYQGKPYRALDLLNHFYLEEDHGDSRPFHNCDLFWPTITYLGTYLARRGFRFDYVNLFQPEKDSLKEKLLADDILTIGITTTLYITASPIIEIISFIRQYNRTAKIVVGGPYISNQSRVKTPTQLREHFEDLGADFYVISPEGEQTLIHLLEALKNGGEFRGIENLAYRDGKSFAVNSPAAESNPLEENMVDYSLFPSADLGELVSLRTAKSCPFSCAFCGFPQRAGKYKYLGVDLIEKELNQLRDLGTVTTLTFLDDTFNVPKKRFKEILRLMIKNKYGFKWNSFYRSDHGDEEAIELMAEAGCEGVFLGAESGSDAVLKKMNKTARRKDYLKAVPLLRSAGISTYASLIVGFPGETYDTFEETVSLIEEARPDFYRAQLWYCDPVTPIWERREELGIQGSAFAWSHNTMDHQTACDLIDNMFLCVENSQWMPQYGFEQWSIFYLQRRGLTMAQVKQLVGDFNALIKDKLFCPSKTDADPALIANFARNCRIHNHASATDSP